MNEFEVGTLANDLNTGYMSYQSLTTLSRTPRFAELLQTIESEHEGPRPWPHELIPRKDGTVHIATQIGYAKMAISSGPYKEVHDRLWLAGAVLTLGDVLDAENYFDRGPDLEFLRHLRNGIAHGNRFHLVNGAPRRPARFTGSESKIAPDLSTNTGPGTGTTFEVTSALDGSSVLFDFMGPGDVCDLFSFIGSRLIRIGRGDPPQDLFPKR